MKGGFTALSPQKEGGSYKTLTRLSFHLQQSFLHACGGGLFLTVAAGRIACRPAHRTTRVACNRARAGRAARPGAPASHPPCPLRREEEGLSLSSASSAGSAVLRCPMLLLLQYRRARDGPPMRSLAARWRSGFWKDRVQIARRRTFFSNGDVGGAQLALGCAHVLLADGCRGPWAAWPRAPGDSAPAAVAV